MAAHRAGTHDAFLAENRARFEAEYAAATRAAVAAGVELRRAEQHLGDMEQADQLLRQGDLAAAWRLTRSVNRQRRWRLDRFRFGTIPLWVPGESLRGRT